MSDHDDHMEDHDNEDDYDSAMEDDDDDATDEEEEEDEITFAEHKENGNKFYKKKDYREAIQHYTSAIEVGQKQLEAAAAATDGTGDKDMKEADNTTAPTAEENQVDHVMMAAVHSNRAAAYQMLLMYDKSLNDCNAAIQHNPKFLKVHWRKAKVLTTLGRLDDAIKAYSMGLIHDPNDSKIMKEKEDVKKLQQRYELATDILGKLASTAEATTTSASANHRNARQALAQIDIVLAQCPNWEEAELAHVQAQLRVGGPKNIDSAYAGTTKLLRRSSQQSTGSSTEPKNAELLYVRAECLFLQGAMDDAMKHLKQILSGDPDNKKAFQLVKVLRKLKKQKEAADAAYKARKYDDAIPLYSEAIAVCPVANETYRSKLYFNRAACHNALRKHADCVADCTAALELNADYTKALLRRAASNLLIGGKDECQNAIRDYEAAVALVATEEEESDVKEKLRSAQIQLKRASRRDLYKLLGVSRDATESEIKKAYRKAALKLHPDRQVNASETEKATAEAKFREVNLANEILSDPVKKQRYDQGVDEKDIDDPNAQPGGHGHHGHSHGGGGGFGGMDQETLFQMFMQQQQGGGGGGRPGGGGGFSFG